MAATDRRPSRPMVRVWLSSPTEACGFGGLMPRLRLICPEQRTPCTPSGHPTRAGLASSLTADSIRYLLAVGRLKTSAPLLTPGADHGAVRELSYSRPKGALRQSMVSPKMVVT